MHANDDTPVIDFGSHFLAEEIATADQPESDRVEAVSSDPEAYLRWFNRGGVDRVVLSHPSYMGHDDLRETVAVNDRLERLMTDIEAYYALAAIPVGAGAEEAAAEFDRCLSAGFNGGGVSTTVGGRPLTDPVFEPVWEVADRTGAPVMVHPTPARKLTGDEHVLEPVFQNNHAFGREARLCGSISRVIHTGLLERYPNLTLVFHHYGGNIASMMGRVDLRLHRHEGETKPFEAFKAQLEDRIYVDTSGYFAYTTPLRAALEQFPASNVLLATDAPAEPKTPAELAEYVETIGDVAPRSAARRMLGGNALELMVNV